MSVSESAKAGEVRRFASFDGTGIAFTTAGDGPPVLLLHGFASDHVGNWVAPGVFDALAASHHVVALDARGHGRSDKPHDPAAYKDEAMARDAAALLDHLGIGHVDVVGYSMGAIVAVRLAPREPRVRSLVLGGIGGRVAEGRRPVDSGRVAAAMTADDPSSFGPAARAFRRFAERTGADRQALAAIQRTNAGESRARPDLVQVPTLVVVGDDDRLAGPPEALAARIPDGLARAVTVHGNHLTAMFDPAFTRAILDFLRPGEMRH
ncbi:MAG TPA: alpha/beta fold hydrolase [Acidimicrobiia bacterium]